MTGECDLQVIVILMNAILFMFIAARLGHLNDTLKTLVDYKRTEVMLMATANDEEDEEDDEDDEEEEQNQEVEEEGEQDDAEIALEESKSQ